MGDGYNLCCCTAGAFENGIRWELPNNLAGAHLYTSSYAPTEAEKHLPKNDAYCSILSCAISLHLAVFKFSVCACILFASDQETFLCRQMRPEVM